MKINFDHISFRAKNPSEMKDFIVELLGLKIGFRPDFPFEGYWLYSGDKDVVHIFNDQATFYKDGLINEIIEEESSGKNIINHVCFYSDDYEELMERINKMNLDYSINLVPDSPVEQIFIKAPEDLLLEIQAIPKNKK